MQVDALSVCMLLCVVCVQVGVLSVCVQVGVLPVCVQVGVLSVCVQVDVLFVSRLVCCLWPGWCVV